MRFDDTLSTVIARAARDGGAIQSLWMQIVDILAQDRGTLTDSLRRDALARVETLAPKIAVTARQAAARAIAPYCRNTDLVRLFGRDEPRVASEMLNSVVLNAGQWAEIIPQLPVSSRALLRERRDLPPVVRTMLTSFGHADYSLAAGEEPESDAPAVAQGSIADLLARVEQFRSSKAEKQHVAPVDETGPPPRTFRFECDTQGLIRSVVGAAPGPLIGLDISQLALSDGAGVDGRAVGAFKARSPFRDAYLRVGGDGDLAGLWLITGLPRFEDETGRFVGYRGIARRTSSSQLPKAAHDNMALSGLSADALRQLVHELRTPLNAICGFAEMISTQLHGPVSQAYRLRADAVLRQGMVLTQLLEDLDVAARLERGEIPTGPISSSDPAHILNAVINRVNASRILPAQLSMKPIDAIPQLAIDMPRFDKLAQRFFELVLSAGLAGERVEGRITVRDRKLLVSVARPSTLIGIAESALFNPDRTADVSETGVAPLGFAFGLRIVKRMADMSGAHLDIDRRCFALRIGFADADMSADQF